MLPSVSVVMLCYNHEKYIREAIESVLSQSFTDIEVILVDDGSTDSSLAIARSFTDQRLRIISKPNGGPSDASEVGVSVARAPLIALMSADDVCHTDRIKIQVSELSTHDAGVTFCRPNLIGENSEPLPDGRWPVFFRESFHSPEELYRILFHKGNFICATSVMFRSALIKEWGYIHHGLIQLQDFLLWARWVPHTAFHCSQHRYLFYRIRENEGNLSSKTNQWRTNFEKSIVYGEFFFQAKRSFLEKAFGAGIFIESTDLVFEAQKAQLLLSHKDPIVKKVGVEKLIDLCVTKANCDVLKRDINLDVKEVYDQIAVVMEARSRPRRKSRLSRTFSLLLGKAQSEKRGTV
jgi:glycosyltransferase involved in cell wall biosynthesis